MQLNRRSALMLGSAAMATPLMGCSPKPQAGPDANADFKALSDAWLSDIQKASPAFATYLGAHAYDGELDDISAAGRAARNAITTATAASLAKIDRTALSRDNQVDALILDDALKSSAFTDTELQSWAWDPLTYNDLAGNSLYALVARDFAPVAERLNNAASRMEKIPTLLAEVRKQLTPERVPEIHARTYAGQNMGGVSIIDDQILIDADKLGEADKKRLAAAAEAAKAAFKEHQAWIDAELVPKAKGDFRLGEKLFDAKLRWSLGVSIPRAELLQRAETAAAAIRDEMYDIATGVLKKPATPNVTAAQKLSAIKAAFAIGNEDRPARAELFNAARRTLDEATAYVREKDLVTLPDAPVKVIEMPKFQQGVAVAYCDPPGPLDRKLDTYYAISPIPADWTDAQTKSFLSEYNNSAIYELTVHEAMPGHYLQLWHSNKHPSVLRSVLYSGTFVEGWACYAEDMMVEQGFGADKPFRRLANLKLRLRTVCNAILDQGVHIGGWDEKRAMDFMVNEAFQEEREAAGKWTRARVSSTQLSTYFVGWAEHHELRKAAEARPGFALKAYHDAVLSHGSPPTRFARQLMFDEPIA